MKKTVAFVPCRAGSQRVADKNTRSFAGESNGLIGVKLDQLGRCDGVDEVILSTNDEKVIKIGQHYQSQYKKIEIDNRPDELCSSETTTDAVIEYAANLIEDRIVLWTHVTSPMVDENEYNSMISAYNTVTTKGIYDSLVSVTGAQTFIWNKDGPVNYDRSIEKWPRTQTLEPLYLINSAAFIVDSQLMRKLNDRIGKKPFMYVMDEITSYEVDWEDQFKIAQSIYLNSKLKLASII